MSQSLLAPGAVLVLWTLVMAGWVAATRLPALKKMGVDLKTAPPGGRGAEALFLDHRDEGLQVVSGQHEEILMG